MKHDIEIHKSSTLNTPTLKSGSQSKPALLKSLRLVSLVVLVAVALGFTACEKVIDVSVNDAAQRYVIEGELLSDSSFAQVRITKTRNLNDDNSFETVHGAVVTIKDTLGSIDTLLERSAGIYQTTKLRGVSGRSYMLEVRNGGQYFSALSTMPERVAFDSIQVDSAIFFGQKAYALVPGLTDPAGVHNYYRFILHYNDTTAKDIIVGDDQFADGLRNRRPIFTQVELKPGFKIDLDMECMDQNVYNYWLALAMMQQGSGAQTPVNPPSNIKGGALGYFSAHSTQRRSVVIP